MPGQVIFAAVPSGTTIHRFGLQRKLISPLRELIAISLSKADASPMGTAELLSLGNSSERTALARLTHTEVYWPPDFGWQVTGAQEQSKDERVREPLHPQEENNMRQYLAIAALATMINGNAIAQPANGDANTPAVNTPNAPPNPGAPVAGSNSFTEGQAKSRIELNGFSNVSELRKDDQGVWRGKAMKDGKSVNISLDFQGNVTAQ